MINSSQGESWIDFQPLSTLLLVSVDQISQEAKKVNSIESFKIFDSLNEKNLNIHPVYIKITGRINYGFLLTQLIFLSRKYDYLPFYRLDKYMTDKYGFTEWELREGRKRLSALGIFSIEKRPDGALLYELHVDKLLQLILETSPACRGNLGTPAEETSGGLPRKPDLQPLNNDQVNNDLKTTTVVELELLMRNGEKVSKQKIEYWVNVLKEKKVVNINNILKHLWKKCLSEALKSEIGLMNTFVEKYAPAKDLAANRPHHTVEETQEILDKITNVKTSEKAPEWFKKMVRKD